MHIFIFLYKITAMKSGLIKGILFLAIGVFCIYWTQTHAPGNVGEQLLKKAGGSYSLSEPWYYASLVLGAVLAIYGGLSVYKEVK